MSLTLAIPDDLADALTIEANRLGMSLPDYAIRLLTTAQPPTREMRTGAEIVAYWQAEGLIGTRTDPTDSPVLARQLREHVSRSLAPRVTRLIGESAGFETGDLG